MRKPENLSSKTYNPAIDFIRENFADLLGPNLALLDQPGGIDTLLEMVRTGKIQPRSRRAA
ncbi:MAG: hypothetical protein HYZ27_10565 [Deltaproteobacteria bacterium]|nr:hypothetical protein [Deltaproteobacteria bacterium]